MIVVRGDNLRLLIRSARQDLGNVAKSALSKGHQEKPSIQEVACLKPLTRKGDKSNSTSETLTTVLQKQQRSAVDHHVHERIMFYLAYKFRESARLIQLDTQYSCTSKRNTPLPRFWQSLPKCLLGDEVNIKVVFIERVQQETLMVELVVFQAQLHLCLFQ